MEPAIKIRVSHVIKSSNSKIHAVETGGIELGGADPLSLSRKVLHYLI